MTRIRFQQSLDDLKENLLVMAGLAEQAIQRAIEAYRVRDISICDLVSRSEIAINRLERDIDQAALDPVSTSKIEDLIFQLKTQYTIVIVTHNMQQAARVAEKTGFFLNGRMVEFDSTHKIFTNPSDKRTEDYITGRFG